MAPEQLRAEPVDARADIYALGASLYCALSGRIPFAASNMHAMMLAILKGSPTPLATLVPSLPRELVAIVERAMALDPADRFASAEEMAFAVSPFSTPSRNPRDEYPSGDTGVDSVNPFSNTVASTVTTLG
jgi:serine/threonine-protein kinase